MARFALLYRFKPGKGSEAEEILQGHGRPSGDHTRPKVALKNTTVFRRGDFAVRVFEVEGELDEVLETLLSEPWLHSVSDQLQPYMVDGINLKTTDGFREWFHSSLMDIVTHRVSS